MYVAVKGGQQAIDRAHRLLADRRRGDRTVPALTPDQIADQLALAVNRVMAEGSLADRDLAARALAQARGDIVEAVFLVRALRTTLPRFGFTEPLDTARLERPDRRVSAVFKDLPGGQLLGPTFDYTHRLLDDADTEPVEAAGVDAPPRGMPRVIDILGSQALVESDPDPSDDPEPGDLTRDPAVFPMPRPMRLQALARADEGFVLGLGYSTQRGYGQGRHPFAGEIRLGTVEVEFAAPEVDFPVPLGELEVTECQMVGQFAGAGDRPPQFTRGYGLVFGHNERKAMAMALCDRALRAEEFGEPVTAPAQDEEFVISHCDNVQSTGFVEHLKLPHHVDFQGELELLRRMRAERERSGPEPVTTEGDPA